MRALPHVVACCAVAGLALAAQASTVRFKFAGTITQVNGVPGPVQVGDDYTVAYQFDSNTPDTEPFPNFGQYDGAIDFVEGYVGAHNVSYNFGNITVLNDGFAGDTYGANISNGNSTLAFGLTDFGFGAFTNDSLPLDLDIKIFEAKQFTIHVDVGPTFWEATGNITAFSSEILPDPCYPDCNADGVLTVADFGCFQTAFVKMLPYADCNGDLVHTVADFGCFQTEFVKGCP